MLVDILKALDCPADARAVIHNVVWAGPSARCVGVAQATQVLPGLSLPRPAPCRAAAQGRGGPVHDRVDRAAIRLGMTGATV